jgi:hypothetical protein
MSEALDLRNQPPMSEEERPKKRLRLSQTFMRHTANCPRSGALYLLFGGGAGSHEMDRGTAGHLIAERMGKHALEYGEPTIPHELVREIVNEVVAEVGVAASQIDMLHMIAYHLASALTFDPETIVGLERKVALQIAGYTIVGKIDLAWAKGDRAGVDDYKTSMNLPDNAAWGPGETEDGKKRIRRFLFQTLLYALLLKYGKPVERCEKCGGSGEVHAMDPAEAPEYPSGDAALTYDCPACAGEGEVIEDTPLAPRAQFFDLAEVYPAYMFEDEKGANVLASRRTTITLEELENHLRWLTALVEKIDYRFDTGDWPAVPGSHCSECPARRLCPLPSVLRGDGVIDPATGEILEPVDSNESARAALALRDRLLAEAEVLWNQAKDWADQGNTIVIGDKVYEFASVRSRSVRKKGKNADWDGLVEAVKHAAETGEDFDVDKWIKSNESTRFTKRSLRPDEKTPDYPEEGPTDGSTDGGRKGQAGGGERGAPAGDRGGEGGSGGRNPSGPERFGDDAPF